VVSQMSAQSRFVRIHLASCAISSSLRQESAHAVHASAHALSVSIAAASFRRSRLIDLGYVSIIGIVVVDMSVSSR
jgi:hypothetical protein